jgi:tRNA(Ile2)-agmatinylcytidine synthase
VGEVINDEYMRIGIDDTDSPAGMCTTYLGAVLIRRLMQLGMTPGEARVIRLNPNVTWKTRGNAAVCLEVRGDPAIAFGSACQLVEELADFSCENTNPGVVVVNEPLPPDFYLQAVQDFCEIDEAVALLDRCNAFYRGYKNGRGLIGATAAVCSELPDRTYELLAYRKPERWGSVREVDGESLFAAEKATFPHTWDSVDRESGTVVCVPHTPDPVLFGIRGESPEWVSVARSRVDSEEPALEQVFVTNQGTDVHLIGQHSGSHREGCSYIIRGVVRARPETGRGGHVSVVIEDDSGHIIRCMAYEPTKKFRQLVRSLVPGDEVTVAGSFKRGSINLEKLCIRALASPTLIKPPLCPYCGKRMTSAGWQKGYKCRACSTRVKDPEISFPHRPVMCGWYEVPPSARRHLARPLCRGSPG